MISVCTVTLNGIENYFEIFQQSVLKTKMVNEVLIAKPDDLVGTEKFWEINEIQFRQFGTQIVKRLQQGVEHGLGLHACLDRAKNDYLFFCDPDVFFYRHSIDEFYYNIFQKNKLNIIGISPSRPMVFPYTFFPGLQATLVRKSDLPGSDWLKGKIIDDEGVHRDGKWFIRMKKIPEFMHEFPNPSGDFDTCAYLYLWAKQNNWRWLSFQTKDVHTYEPRYNRSNIKIMDKIMDKEKMLYHAGSSTVGDEENWRLFQEAWKSID